MQTAVAFIPANKIPTTLEQPGITHREISKNIPGSLEKRLVWLLIKLRIFYYSCIILRHPKKIMTTFKSMLNLRQNVWGGDLKKIYKVNGRYYFNQYTPGWPSGAYDTLIKSELRRRADPLQVKEKLSFAFLAVTRKCPMRCEHCFEWDNLNQKESFTPQDLRTTVEMYQQEGVLQFHFSGGEPMVRFKELVELIKFTSKKSECWVLTSGFNVTRENALKLKEAGCRGMVVSIDHYIPELHNVFRGNAKAFEGAVTAIKYAKEAGLVTSVSVCVTKNFIDGGHVLPYIEFASSLGVQFIQLLEPRNIGHYEGKNVLLEENHIVYLEEVFKKFNHSKACKNYPTLLYHGYHQRRVGCFSGSRSVYIDSAGDVHACPFCHTKSFNVIEQIRSGKATVPQKENACPLFNKIA